VLPTIFWVEKVMELGNAAYGGLVRVKVAMKRVLN